MRGTEVMIWSTFALKSVLNIGEFEISALASYAIFSNETIANW